MATVSVKELGEAVLTGGMAPPGHPLEPPQLLSPLLPILSHTYFVF